MVYHVLKDGTVKTDITGHVVKMEDAEAVYDLMRELSETPKRSESK